MRRLNRTVNKEDSVYPPLLSKYPLIESSTRHAPQRETKIIRGVPFPNIAAADEVAALRIQAEQFVPRPQPVDHTKRFDSAILRRVLLFLGDCPSDLAPINAVNKAWRQATFNVIDEIVLFPTTIPFESEPARQETKLKSLTTFFNNTTRGQHLRRVTVVDSRCVSQLPQSLKGPRIGIPSIQRLLSQTPNVSHLDLRGIDIQEFVPIADKFFASLHILTPCLRSLKVGAYFLRNWSPLWWARLPYLSEFVVGSRREDADWDDASPIALHEDVFGMLRSPAHVWAVVKVWTALSQPSFSALIFPSSPFPRVVSLTVNALGNCSLKPLEEGIQDAPKDEKKKAEKTTKKGSQQDDSAGYRGNFPSLVSLTVADVVERTDFSVELMAKMTQQAPYLKHFNVTNTLRSAPTHIEPPAAKGRRAKRVA